MCYNEKSHEHKMARLGLDIDAIDGGKSDGAVAAAAVAAAVGSDVCSSESGKNSEGTKVNINPHEARKQSIERCIKSLEHATYCDDKQCQIQSCIKMKKVVSHAKNCKRKNNQGCPICRQLIALCCFHAKSCTKPQCLVPYCHPIKAKLQQQQEQQKIHQRQIIRRRIAQMTRNAQPPIPTTPQPAANPQPSPIQQPQQQPQPMSQKPSPMRTLPTANQKPMPSQMPLSSMNSSPSNVMVSTPMINPQQPVEMPTGMKPMPPMGGMVPTQPRFVGPGGPNFPGGQGPAGMANPNVMGNTAGPAGMMGQMPPQEWQAAMLQQVHAQRQAAAQQAHVNSMMGHMAGGMPHPGQPMPMQNMPNASQMTPQLMRQFLNAMRSSVPHIRNNQHLLSIIQSQQRLKQPNNFMPGMNNGQPPGMGGGPPPPGMQMSQQQWQLQQRKRVQQQMQQRMNMMNAAAANAAGYNPQMANQQGNPRMMVNRQFPQEMPPPGGPAQMMNSNVGSPQMMPPGGGRVTPGMSHNQMMSPQPLAHPNMMSPPQPQIPQIPTHSPRPAMSPSPSMQAPSPCPVMSPQQMAVQSPLHTNLTSPMHNHNSPASQLTNNNPTTPMDMTNIQQPGSVHSDRGGGPPSIGGGGGGMPNTPLQNPVTPVTPAVEPTPENDVLEMFVDQL